MSFAERIGDVLAKDKEIDETLSLVKQREHILLQLRAVVAFPKGATMPSVPRETHVQPVILGRQKCIVPKCARAAAKNLDSGLCLVCHGKAKKLVESGVTSWAKLEALGLVTKVEDSSDPFTQAFNAANKE